MYQMLRKYSSSRKLIHRLDSMYFVMVEGRLFLVLGEGDVMKKNVTTIIH